MAIELAKAYVQIIPSADGISSGIESVIGGDIQKASESSGKSFGSNFLKIGAGVIAAGAGAVTAAASAVWKNAMDTAKVGDEIDKTSQKLGVSAEQYQALAFAAEHSGFEVSTFTTAAKKLGDSDFDGNIYDALNAIMALDDETERAAMAQELFGDKAAMAMQPLLNGEQDIADFRDELESIGGLMSDESVKASAAFEDSLTNLQTAFGGLKNGLMGDFLPSITQVMDGITLLMNGDDNGLAMIKEGISNFLDSLEDMIPEMLEIGASLLETFVQVIIDNLPQIVEMGVKLILQLAIGIIKAIPDLVKQIPQIIKAIVGALKDALPDLLDAGKNLVEGIWEGINGAIDWLKEKITKWVGNVTDFIKGLFGIASPSKLMRDEIGKFIPQGIAVGIEANSDSVQRAMNGLADIAVDSFVPEVKAPRGKLATSNYDNDIKELIKALSDNKTNITVTLEGDAQRLFSVIQSQSKTYKQLTGMPAFG